MIENLEKNTKFTFIDLFAGIGGFRIAFEKLGGKCLFSSEIDKFAAQTYEANFNEKPHGDIRQESVKDLIPNNCDILSGGFPCQAFSEGGLKKGFKDERGTLFFDIVEIIKKKKPKVFFLENVKGLTFHDKGKTLKTMLDILRNELDYFVPNPEILNSKNFGVAQNRERIYIIGFRKDLNITNFSYPSATDTTKRVKDIIEKTPVEKKYYVSERALKGFKERKERNKKKKSGFVYQVYEKDSITNTLTAAKHEHRLIIDDRIKDFSEFEGTKKEKNKEYLRMFTPRECARLQGFRDDFKIVCSNTQTYKQFGNTVTVPVIEEITKKILISLMI